MSGRNAQVVDEVHRRVGRNLLRFQEIEESLRFTVPYMNPGPQPLTVEDVRDTQERVRDMPLGGLIKEFKSAVAQLDSYWAETLQNILNARNELVHEFYRNRRFDLLSDQGATDALSYLDEQYHAAEEWHTILRTQGLLLLIDVVDASPLIAREYAQHRDRLIASLPSSVELGLPQDLRIDD